MNEQRPTLTTRQGHPVRDNQSLRSVGERGPATLENYQFIEKITHFDRERIPERVVHARGTGAHGYFEAYGKMVTSRPANSPAPASSTKWACRRRCSCASRP
jgi:catalase